MDPRRLNESLQELLCRPGNGTGSANGTGTGPTWNGSACDLLRRGLRGPPAPKGEREESGMEWDEMGWDGTGRDGANRGAAHRSRSLPVRRVPASPRCSAHGDPGGGSDCAGAAKVPSGGGREPREAPGSPAASPHRAAFTWGCPRRVMPAPFRSAPGDSSRGSVRARSGARARRGSAPGSGSSAFPPPAVPELELGPGGTASRHRVLAPQEPPGTARGWRRSRSRVHCAACDRAPAELDLTVRVLLYALIFVLSVCGNALVVAVLLLNRRLRTVTNSFLLSLALSDLMLALCCMPFTLIPNLMGTFIFGEAVCKLMAYLMGVSVSVSTFSLVAIAIERYSAICNPLQSRVWQTRSHACRVIASTWLFSALLMLPYAVYSTTRLLPVPGARPPLSQCTHAWPSEHVRQAWYVLLLLVLFFIPGVVMIVAYGLISRELYRGIRFELDIKGEAAAQRGSEPLPTCDEGDGCYLQLSRPGGALELRALGTAGAQQERARINSSEAKLVAKRRVIRMLVVIVAMFFLCWLPIFAANTWRAFAPRAAQRALSGTPISFIHLLSYTSACANPLIYCFMNRRFRSAFLGTCAGCRRSCPRRAPDEDAANANASLSKFSYTTVSSLGPP